jgi:predicted Zn finger-like uncharacterized protein
MNLTTRCPSCGTAFRVQPAQLSARGGKVRCGKCSGVFDGVKALLAEGAAPARSCRRSTANPRRSSACSKRRRSCRRGDAANEDVRCRTSSKKPQPPGADRLGAGGAAHWPRLLAQATYFPHRNRRAAAGNATAPGGRLRGAQVRAAACRARPS